MNSSFMGHGYISISKNNIPEKKNIIEDMGSL